MMSTRAVGGVVEVALAVVEAGEVSAVAVAVAGEGEFHVPALP